jgi:hypothetical protein
MYKFVLFFIFSYGYYTVTTAQEIEKSGKYTFIRYDSIPMGYIYDRESNTNSEDASYYYKALTPSYPLIKTYVSTYNSRHAKIGEIDTLVNFDFYGTCYCNDDRPHDPRYIYKTYVNDKMIVIGTHEKFREIFAPVESLPEAIAFAYILNCSRPLYNLDFLKPETQRPKYSYLHHPVEKEIRLKNGETRIETAWIKDSIENLPPAFDGGWDIHQPEIISSHGKKTDDGYELLLYGCGSHEYFRRLLKVSFNGEVKILEQIPAFSQRVEYKLILE